VAPAIGPDTSGAAAAQALDEPIAAGRQLDLAMVKAIGRVDRSGIYGQDGSVRRWRMCGRRRMRRMGGQRSGSVSAGC
jgi:hypothetical protein